jgi:diguanylate cyclase (GGDEF)-like protein/PAS domain S-box-containing protein
LTEPHKAILEPERRRRARMLSTILLALLLLGLLSTAATVAMEPTGRITVAETLWLLAAIEAALASIYVVSRTSRYALAALLTLAMLMITFSTFVISSGNASSLKYAVLTVLLASLFFSLRGTVLAIALTLGGMALLLGIPTIATSEVIDKLFFVLIVGTLAVVSAFVRQQDLQHIERQTRQMAESEERFRAVVQSAHEAIITVDGDGRIVAWNVGAQEMFGRAEADMLGQPVSTLVPKSSDEALAAWLQELKVMAETGAADRVMEATGLRHDGQQFPSELSVVAWQAGAATFYTAFVRDITQRKQAEAALQQSHEKLAGLVADLEKHTREIALLNDLGDFLQAARNREEADGVIGQYGGWLFPSTLGAVYAYSPSRDDLEAAAEWGGEAAASLKRAFRPEECWALRRGRIHVVGPAEPGLACEHLAGERPAAYLCVPMMAQGEALGVMHLRLSQPDGCTDEVQRLASMVAEHIGLALANLNLRETLRSQSIRDPLTGLFNRRYLEETLGREISRAERSQQPLGLMMIDIDHFKQFNDTYGHDAGDEVLQTLGHTLDSFVRAGDIACRYGGEEFVLVLPEAPLDVTRRRADELRLKVKDLSVKYRGQLLHGIALSLGVACYPEHGLTREALLRSADQALYRAKQQGRDRVEVAG